MFDHLFALRQRHGDDIEAAVLEWRRFLADRDRERCLAKGRPRHAFRICPDWGHFFAEDVPEETVRWVFDRRSWSLVHLQILEETTGTWRTATDAELADVDESLVVANEAALTDAPEDWGCLDADELPETGFWPMSADQCAETMGELAHREAVT